MAPGTLSWDEVGVVVVDEVVVVVDEVGVVVMEEVVVVWRIRKKRNRGSG